MGMKWERSPELGTETAADSWNQSLGLGCDWVSLAIMLVFPMAALLYRMHVEERTLAEAFGAEYADDCQATKRLMSGIY